MKYIFATFLILLASAASPCDYEPKIDLRGWVWHNALFQEDGPNENAWGMRGTLVGTLPCNINFIARIDGNVLPNPENPGFERVDFSTFRAAEFYLGLNWTFWRNFSLAGIVGQAFPIGETFGDPDPIIAGGGFRVGNADRYAYVLLGINEAVTGVNENDPVIMATVAYEIDRGISLVGDFAYNVRNRLVDSNYTRIGIAYALPF